MSDGLSHVCPAPDCSAVIWHENLADPCPGCGRDYAERWRLAQSDENTTQDIRESRER
jgi:hypothetical protein